MDFVKKNAWALGLATGFLVVVLVNVGFIVLAVKGADPVVASYEAEAR